MPSTAVSKKEGGLCIKNLKSQNQSSMLKWLWRFVSHEESLWKEVIKEKYDMEGKWTTKTVEGPYGVSLWKSIRNLWPKLMNKVSFKVGNDMKIYFWEDKWLGQGALKQLFPDLHILSQQHQATIGEVWSNR